MRAVITRCSEASVEVDGVCVGSLPAPGLVVLLGVTHTDTAREAETLARKIAGLRIVDGERSALDLQAPVLAISQFTLFGDVRKGRRPSWSNAAPGTHAEPLFNEFVRQLREAGLHVETGAFGAMMRVHSVNEGPFTLVVDTTELA